MSTKFPDCISGYFHESVDERPERLEIYGSGIPEIEAEKEYQVLLLQSDNPGFRKRIVEASLNLYSDVATQSLHVNLKNPDDKLTDQGFDPEIALIIHDLGRFSGYLLNCSSWDDQKLHDFDKRELRKRLLRVANQLKTQSEVDAEHASNMEKTLLS